MTFGISNYTYKVISISSTLELIDYYFAIKVIHWTNFFDMTYSDVRKSAYLTGKR